MKSSYMSFVQFTQLVSRAEFDKKRSYHNIKQLQSSVFDLEVFLQKLRAQRSIGPRTLENLSKNIKSRKYKFTILKSIRKSEEVSRKFYLQFILQYHV